MGFIETISQIPSIIRNTFYTIQIILNMLIENYIIPKKWYIIEGNIGCGKTTLIRNLKKSGDFEVIEEPVEEWKSIQNEEGENILGLFYKDGPKYAYLFQTIVFKSRIRALEIQQKKPIRFSERSIWTDKNIFSKNCYEMGLMNTVEKSTYDFWFSWLESKIKRMPDGIIYLRASAETCLERMKKRDRVEETSVSLDYLSKIHEKHEEWLNATRYNNIPIYIIENSAKPEESLKKVMDIIKVDSGIGFNMKLIIKKFQEFLGYSKTFVSYSFHLITNGKFMKQHDKKLGKQFDSINIYYKYLLFNIWFVDIPLVLYYLFAQ